MWLKTPSASLKLRGVLLLFLLATSCAWVLKGKKGGKDAPQERVPKTKVQASLPPTTFLRIFALPSEEAKMAQVKDLFHHSCNLSGLWSWKCNLNSYKRVTIKQIFIACMALLDSAQCRDRTSHASPQLFSTAFVNLSSQDAISFEAQVCLSRYSIAWGSF